MVDLAKKYSIPHFIYSSVIGADLHTGIPHWESKYQVENYIKASGLLDAALFAFTDNEEDETIKKAANKFDKKINYDNEQVLEDDGVDYDNLDTKYPALTQTVVELNEE